jgi:predicted dehydrogenase
MTTSTNQIPQPNIIDPASVPSLRWGIMGAALIAEEWVGGVQKHTPQQVLAVASRTPGKAATFAEKFGLETEESYESLLAREDIDAVYIPTLGSQHLEHALLATEAGKHCLVEKPITLKSAEAEQLFAAAKAKGVLAMEAMWTRYLPQFDVARQVIAKDLIGEVDLVVASFCYDLRHVKRLWAKNQGSPIYDIGIYPIAFAQLFLGNPDRIEAVGQLTPEGIDAETQITLHYNSGARARLFVSGIASSPVRASVSGSKNTLDFAAPFFTPTSVSLVGRDVYLENDTWVDNTGVVGHEGLSYTATAFASFVGLGLLDSPLHSHADSIANIKVCEEVIRQLGADVY